MVWDLSGRENLDDIYIEYQSFFVPPRIYHVKLAERKLGIWEEPQIPLDPNRFQADLVWYSSKDGTRVSMMIVHRKDLIRDGKAPVILQGVWRLSIRPPILPRFDQEALAWLENGRRLCRTALKRGGGKNMGKRGIKAAC